VSLNNIAVLLLRLLKHSDKIQQISENVCNKSFTTDFVLQNFNEPKIHLFTNMPASNILGE